MAQLRCAQTSELLMEGTPLEVATAAEAFPKGEVLFDDVGAKFDPAAVRQVRADELAGLERSLAELPTRGGTDDEKSMRDSVKAALADRRDRIANGQKAVAGAKAARDAALARVEERRKKGS